MQLQFNGAAYSDVSGWVAIDFWTADAVPKKFIVRVSKAYVRNRGWNSEIGLTRCVEAHREELRSAAQRAFDDGAVELLFLT